MTREQTSAVLHTALLLALAMSWGCGTNTLGSVDDGSADDTTEVSSDDPADNPSPEEPSTQEPDDTGTDPVDTTAEPEPTAPVSVCENQPHPVYPLTDEPYTTLQKLWAPKIPSTWTKALITTGVVKVTDIEAYEEHDLGVEEADGLDWIIHRELEPASGAGAHGTRKSLAYIWQAADPQVIDEESPIRFEPFTQLFRPQGHLVPQAFEASVRTAQRISDLSSRPFDFAVLAGDLTDGSQQNELGWVIDILNGGIIDPDSGIDDDPVEGPGNDYNDPFCSDGLAVPWYAAIGNHETLYNGGFGSITDELREAAMGTEVYNGAIFPNGYRDGSSLFGDVIESGSLPADPKRLVLRLREVLQALLEAGGEPMGHGLTQADVDEGMGYYSVRPMPDKPIRLITLKTVDSDAIIGLGHEGYIDDIQFDWLQEELERADDNHEVVVVVSHHGADEMGFTSPTSSDALKEAMLDCEGMMLHLVGHGHNNAKHLVEGSESQGGYWELMLASTLDFPLQSRIIELVDDDNGFMSIYVTNVGLNAPEGSLAHEARRLAAAKLNFTTLIRGSVEDYWTDEVVAQNLLLRVPLSGTLRESLGEHDWPEVIESTATLQSFH